MYLLFPRYFGIWVPGTACSQSYKIGVPCTSCHPEYEYHVPLIPQKLQSVSLVPCVLQKRITTYMYLLPLICFQSMSIVYLLFPISFRIRVPYALCLTEIRIGVPCTSCPSEASEYEYNVPIVPQKLQNRSTVYLSSLRIPCTSCQSEASE